MADIERSKITPPKLARRWGISPEKVLAWIHGGELEAFNAATRPDGRPRYLIDEADIADFERRRGAMTKIKVRRRPRQRPTDVIEFF